MILNCKGISYTSKGVPIAMDSINMSCYANNPTVHVYCGPRSMCMFNDEVYSHVYANSTGNRNRGL